MHKITLKDKLAVYNKLEQLKSKLNNPARRVASEHSTPKTQHYCLSWGNTIQKRLNDPYKCRRFVSQLQS
jgi:hypothetical protein